ncbi:MAG: type I-E CRISPR-associated protein Cas5/CasD [Dehalococcoidia bacterium]|nr:type I-E CRISPR-associated protein Cas5/CasD [Dehalococcoidia bacterium]
MLSTLLLFLAGPMQSWGTRSRFTERDTGLEPSKSGVIGLLCAAMAIARTTPVDAPGCNLAGLRMGVRIDQEGVMRRDYHTAGGGGLGIARADGSHGKDAVVSDRYYLADAQFLVGLEGEDEALVNRIQAALVAPVWQLSLGRKAFVPSVPVHLADGLQIGIPLKQALEGFRWPVSPLCPLKHQPATTKPDPLRLALEITFNDTPTANALVEVRMDQPEGAAFQTRAFRTRRVLTDYCTPNSHKEA